MPQYASTETETWSCLSVPPPALHAVEAQSGGGGCRAAIRHLGCPIWKAQALDRSHQWYAVDLAEPRQAEARCT